jgi:glycosyltransferase involved in cell wall biosynthesis
MKLTVLHLSHTGLPDPRVERLALLAKSYCHSMFLGPTSGKVRLSKNAFENVYTANEFSTGSILGLPGFYSKLRHEVGKFISQINPDLIYAHNVIAGKIASDLSTPFVYDDHEYWTRQALLRRIGNFNLLTKLKNSARYFLAPRVYRKWEKQIFSSAAAIVTVSEAIAKEHKRRNPMCVVVPNFPLSWEFEKTIPLSAHKGYIRAICLASDFEGTLEHRQASKNIDALEQEGGMYVDWVGKSPPSHWKWIKKRSWISPSKIISTLASEYQIGLMPYQSHWYHRYSMPNKAASYSNAGLILVLNNDYYSLRSFFPKWSYYTFKNVTELKSIVRVLRNKAPEDILITRLRLQNWAHEHVVLERYSDNLKTAILRTQK